MKKRDRQASKQLVKRTNGQLPNLYKDVFTFIFVHSSYFCLNYMSQIGIHDLWIEYSAQRTFLVGFAEDIDTLETQDELDYSETKVGKGK